MGFLPLKQGQRFRLSFLSLLGDYSQERYALRLHWMGRRGPQVNPLSSLGKRADFTQETLSTLYQQQPLLGGLKPFEFPDSIEYSEM